MKKLKEIFKIEHVTVEDVRAYTILEMMYKIINKINEVITLVCGYEDRIEDVETNKMSLEQYENDITNVRKLDKNANFTGSWYGITHPVQSEPGIQGVVNQLLDKVGDMTGIKEYEYLVVDGDWSQAIQRAIDDGAKHLVFDEGTYFVSKQGSDSRGKDYCILIEDKKDVVIEFKENAKITIDFSLNDLPNIFCVQRCENVRLINVNAEGINQRLQGNTSALYTGGAIMINDSSYVTVDGGKFHNLLYGTQVFYSKHCTVQNTMFTHDYYEELWGSGAVPFSAIILYSTSDSYVLDNVIYGGLRDGDLSIFGGLTYNCTVQGNKMYGYGYNREDKKSTYLGQGLTVDQGPKACHIVDNSIYGYYYGIDLKADTYDCLVNRNIIENCKVGIADRQGEATHVSETLGHVIESNKIIMQDSWDAPFKFFDMYYVIGILCEKRQQAVIRNNYITVKNISGGFITRQPCCGIYVSGNPDLAREYQFPPQITNNYIMFINSVRAIVTHAVSGSVFFHFKNVYEPLVANNVIKASYGNTSYRIFKLEGDNTRPMFIENRLDYVANYDTHISYVDSNSKMTNEVIKDKTTYGTYRLESTNANQSYDTIPIAMPYDGVAIVKVSACQSWAGIRTIDATFQIKRTSNSIEVTLLDGVVNGFTYGGGYNGATVYLKFATTVAVSSPIVFRAELVTQSNHKLLTM